MLLPKRTYSLDQLTQELSYQRFCESGNDNREEIKRMKIYISKAIKHELTQKQRYCLCEYYLHQRTMTDIANELSISQPAVTKHIKRAVEKLKRQTVYC